MPGSVQLIERLTPEPAPEWLAFRSERLPAHGEPLGFSLEEYEARHTRVIEAIAQRRVDALLVTRISSVDWLTGFHSIAQFPLCAVVTPTRIALCLPEAEIGRAIAGSTADEIRYFGSSGNPAEQIANWLLRENGTDAAVGMDCSSWQTSALLHTALLESGFEPLDVGQLVERLRLVLSAAEQDRVREAARITARGLDAANEEARRPRATDSSVAAAVLKAMTEGAQSLARGNLAVATDWRGGVTHSTWNGTPLGACTFLEFSGGAHRYAAPVMRTLVRQPPSETVRRLDWYARTALQATLEALRPGVTAAAVAREASNAIGPLDPTTVFHYTFGYPIGVGQVGTWLDGADFYLRTENEEAIVEGMAFHLPMSFRSVGVAGVGQSQTVIVQPNGPEVVTSSAGPAELIEIA